ncbi:MAG TPA: glycosyl hydrolase family 8 [Polyangiaceae bacterium]|nr:glycosyl hydrolase family 8 [Polyangiaceae bacterium]
MHRPSFARPTFTFTGALLAILVSACSGPVEGTRDDGSGDLEAFGGPGPGRNDNNPPANEPNQPGAPPSGTGTTPGNGTNPETQPGGITLDPGTTPPANGETGEVTPPTNGETGEVTPPVQQPPVDPGNAPAPFLERPTRGSGNLFTEVLGIPVGEVDAKMDLAVKRFFGIGTNEPNTPTRDQGWRVYYELPQDRNMAFIWTTDANDIRSEGMSYGMMISVQMDMQSEFDKLWRFAQRFMQLPGNSTITSWRYNFRWQGSVNTSNANNWQINFPEANGPAPDGDEYFAAALYLADRRWGSGGGINYQQEADNIANAMINNPAAGGRTPLFNAANNLVVFYPQGNSANFSDPSYNLPAFYELFAIDGSQNNSARWNAIADSSRRHLVNSAHPTTGLHPDYANFGGSPNNGGSNHDQFRFDAWRVVMNMAMDYAWFSQDARFTTQANKYHAFFANQLNDNKDNVRNATFAIDGSNAGGGSSTALTAMLGAGALASTAANRADFVQAAWDVYQQSGQYRYYQEATYLLGMLNASGLYGYEWAQ